MTVRERALRPPLHCREHALQAPKRDTSQSMGQANELHARLPVEAGHFLPPWLGSTRIRERDWEPPPQVLEQTDHVLQAPALQSTGQACALQVPLSTVPGHLVPPCFGSTTVRVRERVPLPQERVHFVHAPHLPTTQLMGHWWSLQSFVSSSLGQE